MNDGLPPITEPLAEAIAAAPAATTGHIAKPNPWHGRLPAHRQSEPPRAAKHNPTWRGPAPAPVRDSAPTTPTPEAPIRDTTGRYGPAFDINGNYLG